MRKSDNALKKCNLNRRHQKQYKHSLQFAYELQSCKKDESGDFVEPHEIWNRITSNFEGIVVKSSWGETSCFYNPGNRLPNGVYFCTIKEKDGANDQSSNLTREGIYRLSVGLPKEKYVERFGRLPKRPEKGGFVNTGHDFTQTNLLMPHPIYAWMGWVCVLSPTTECFDEIYPLIESAYRKAEQSFRKKVKQMKKRMKNGIYF